MSALPLPLAFDAPEETRLLLDGLGRTEDVKFAPSGAFVTIAEFLANRVVLVPLRVEELAGAVRISAGRASLISSKYLRQPHGVHFLDDAHMVVANRRGDVAIFDVSRAATEPGEYRLGPVGVFSARRGWRTRVRTPGSVAVYPDGEHPLRHRVLVCNNDWHTVSAHTVDVGEQLQLANDGVRIEAALAIPDGIDVSPDRRWIAVSNHVPGEVLFYENDATLGPRTPPSLVLSGLVCPHGLRFAAGGRMLLAADSASPYLYVVERTGERWDAGGVSMQAVRMVDDDTFWRCRVDARDGGIKGIDVHRGGRVFVATRRYQVLGFYDIADVFAKGGEPDRVLVAELSRYRDRLLQVQKSDALDQRWRARTLLRAAVRRSSRRMRNRASGFRARVEVRRRELRNRWSRESIVAPSGPIVTMATYGARVETAFAAIESIARGDVRPSRMLLWLGGASDRNPLPEPLRRLAARGLEINYPEDFGPHSKYFPYLATEERFALPLVTADDDALYPRTWLRDLVNAHDRNPHAIHAFRVHRMELAGRRLLSYVEWAPCQGTRPSHLNFATGVSGVVYPAEFLGRLKAAGRGFMSCCPRHDDVWLKVQALRAGFPVAQVRDEPLEFRPVPGSPVNERLSRFNVREGGAHAQILATFSATDMAALCAEAEADRRPLVESARTPAYLPQ